MSKKNIIILIIVIAIFIGALALFLYANSLGTKNNQEDNNANVDTTIIDSAIVKGPIFYDMDGNEFNLDDFSDKPSVVLLWKSDNAKSYTMINLLTNYYETYKDKINFLAINVNEPEIDDEIIENVRAVEFQIPMYFDTNLELAQKYNYQKYPVILFLSQDGNLEKDAIEEIKEDAFVANLELLTNNY